MRYTGRFTKPGNSKRVLGDDPVLGAVLSFIERDMIIHPKGIQPVSADLLARAERLVGGMQVNLDAPLG